MNIEMVGRISQAAKVSLDIKCASKSDPQTTTQFKQLQTCICSDMHRNYALELSNCLTKRDYSDATVNPFNKVSFASVPGDSEAQCLLLDEGWVPQAAEKLPRICPLLNPC